MAPAKQGRELYEPVARDIMALFTPGREQEASVKEIASATGHSESAVGHVKVFLSAVGAVTTRFEARLTADGKVAGKKAVWQIHMEADEAIRLLEEYDLADFSQANRDTISRFGEGQMGRSTTSIIGLMPTKHGWIADRRPELEREREREAAKAKTKAQVAPGQLTYERQDDLDKILGPDFSEQERAIIGANQAGATQEDLLQRFNLTKDEWEQLLRRAAVRIDLFHTGQPSLAHDELLGIVEPEPDLIADATTATPSMSTKERLFQLFKDHADERGIVQRLTWLQVQQEIGGGAGLHSIFHLCRSLQRDGVVRFNGLPTKLSTAKDAGKAFVVMTVVDKTRTVLPPPLPHRPETPPLRPAAPSRSGPVRQVVPPTNGQHMPTPPPPPPAPIIVPPTMPAPTIEPTPSPIYVQKTPMPPTPVADGLMERQTKLRIAFDALVDAGETDMADTILSKVEDMTPAEVELMRIVKWARER